MNQEIKQLWNTNMIEIQKLVVEIEMWNDGDADTCKESESGCCVLDLDNVDERSIVIARLSSLVRENHLLSSVENS